MNILQFGFNCIIDLESIIKIIVGFQVLKFLIKTHFYKQILKCNELLSISNDKVDCSIRFREFENYRHRNLGFVQCN